MKTADRQSPSHVLHHQVQAQGLRLKSLETVMHVKASRLFVQGVNDHQADANSLGHQSGGAQGVEQQVGTQPSALMRLIDRQTSEQDGRYLMPSGPTSVRSRTPVNLERAKAVIPNDKPSGACHVGSSTIPPASLSGDPPEP
jgi:hypothetical protein